MRKTIQTIAILSVGMVGLMACGSSGLEERTSAQAGAPAAQQVPKFRVEPSWPKVPSKWIMAIVSSTAIDDQDHLWVLQRPNTLTAEEKPKAAPSVMEFDADGNFLQGWGGPGDGYDWPESEHGIYVDPKGFVWIGGQGEEDQILKFTKAGRFVMQIGTRGQKKTNQDTRNLWKPADVFVHPATNELFVADGYGNKRIVVFDADTGTFKRMWGAFGSVPIDDPPAPPRPVGGGRGEGAGAATPAQPMGPDGAPQFVPPVHAVKVSNDGLVYVGDRGGRRVQVFTLAGEYLNQVFIGRECHAPDCGNGTTAAGLAFSRDPDQQLLYVANRSQAQVMVFNRKTLAFLDSFGQWGSEPGQFGTLHHLSVDSKGNLYTAEVTPMKPVNRRVQKFTLTGFVPLPTVDKKQADK